MEWLLLVVALFCGALPSSADLSLNGVQCGAKTCKFKEYCSEYDKLCQPCANICDNKTHNFDPAACQKDCQDYIHDARYVKKDDSSDDGMLRNEVHRLHVLVSVTLTLVCLILASVIAYKTWKWKTSNNVTLSSLKSKIFSKKADNANKVQQNGVNETAGKPDLRLEMPASTIQSESPSTLTTSISRRPAEDSALDYAYDNPAMSSNTSSPNVKPHESSF